VDTEKESSCYGIWVQVKIQEVFGLDITLIYCYWVSTLWQWSVDL